MRVGFIGSGKVSKAFGLYLRDKNVSIAGYYSRSRTSAASAADLVQTETFHTLEALLAAADWIGITTPDDQIEAAAAELALLLEAEERQSSGKPSSKTFFHMSGAKGSESLYPLSKAGHACFSLHPLQTISEPVSGRERLAVCRYTAEGDRTPEIEAFAAGLGQGAIWITAAQKPLYHAAACVASNYLYTLAHQAVTLMRLAGFEDREAFWALEPLMRGTLDNLHDLAPELALTGPISRGDVQTIQRHLEAMAPHEAILAQYKNMGLATLQLATVNQLKDPTVARALNHLLGGKEERDDEQ